MENTANESPEILAIAETLKAERGRKPSTAPKFTEKKKMYAIYLTDEEAAYLNTNGQNMTGNVVNAVAMLRKFFPKGFQL